MKQNKTPAGFPVERGDVLAQVDQLLKLFADAKAAGKVPEGYVSIQGEGRATYRLIASPEVLEKFRRNYLKKHRLTFLSFVSEQDTPFNGEGTFVHKPVITPRLARLPRMTESTLRETSDKYDI